MWKYIRKYAGFALVAAAFMVGEVLMDLLQPELMIRSSCMDPHARQTKFEEVRP